MWSPIPPISNLVDLQGVDYSGVCVHYNTYMHSIVTMLVASPEQDQIHGFLKAMNDSSMRERIGFCRNLFRRAPFYTLPD